MSKASGSQAPRYDLQELKRRAGVAPFQKRLQLGRDGFCACPFHEHDGKGSKTFHVTMREDGAGIGTCFSACGKSFDAIDFVRRMDAVTPGEAIQRIATESGIGANPAPQPNGTVIEFRKPSAVPMTTQGWAKFGRAVTDDDIRDLAASRPHSATPGAAALNELGFRVADRAGKAWLFAPYRVGDTFHTLKARALASKDFIQENCASQKGLFNIDKVKPGCDVFIVESELDAALLNENGYVAVSVVSSTQKDVEPDVLSRLNRAGRIFLVGDQDRAGQGCMDAIFKLLPPEKRYRITFSEGKDVGELALQRAKDDFLGTFREEIEYLKADALASWIAKNIPFASSITNEPVQWVIDRILPLGGFLLISGKYGSMKSLVSLFAAGGIEAGTNVFGRRVLRPIPVLYIDRENPRQVVASRRNGLGIPPKAVRYWGDWLENATPNLDDPRLAEFAVRERGVIIFDSLTDWLAGANENDPSAMTEIMHKFRRLARLGAGVIVLHHADKYRSGYRGTTAIPSGTDMALKIAKRDDGSNVIELREERFRMCSSWEMDIKFHFGEQYTVEIVKDEDHESHRRAEKQAEEQTVFDIISKDRKASLRYLSNLAGINRRRVLDVAERAGWKFVDGQWECVRLIA